MCVHVDVRICDQMVHHMLRLNILRHLDLVCRSFDCIFCADCSLFHKLWITDKSPCLEIEHKPRSSCLHSLPSFLVCKDKVPEEEKAVESLVPCREGDVLLPFRRVGKHHMDS